MEIKKDQQQVEAYYEARRPSGDGMPSRLRALAAAGYDASIPSKDDTKLARLLIGSIDDSALESVLAAIEKCTPSRVRIAVDALKASSKTA